jgi:hypothetical protein
MTFVNQFPQEQAHVGPGDGGNEPVLEEGVEVLPEHTLPVAPGGLLEDLPRHPVGEVPVEGQVLPLGRKELDPGAVGEVPLVLEDAVGDLGLHELQVLPGLLPVTSGGLESRGLGASHPLEVEVVVQAALDSSNGCH